jgi:GxxExxY protein
MPIVLHSPIRRLSQREFGDVAFEVMRHVFAIHNDLGRLFDERIYKNEIANRLPDVRLEEPIDVAFDSFHKRLFMDVLVGDGAVFEFKAAERISPAHRAQLLNYLLLCNLAHGKVINVRSDSVQHEFVNTTLKRAERGKYRVNFDRWSDSLPGAAQLREVVTALLLDWGAGLEILLYDEAVVHLLGGQEAAAVPVTIGGRQVGTHRVHMAAPTVGFRLTALTQNLEHFENHARRLLAHLNLRALAWINITIHQLTFTTLEV